MKNQVVVATLLLSLISCESKPVPPVVTNVSVPKATTTAVGQSEPRVITPRGATIGIEVASNDETRERGLMFRDRLDEQRGMLFIFPKSEVYPFWMKNTLIPLDMLWLDEQKKIVHITSDVPPCRADPCQSYSPGVAAKYVLEIGAARAKALGLNEGETLRFEGIDLYRVN